MRPKWQVHNDELGLRLSWYKYKGISEVIVNAQCWMLDE